MEDAKTYLTSLQTERIGMTSEAGWLQRTPPTRLAVFRSCGVAKFFTAYNNNNNIDNDNDNNYNNYDNLRGDVKKFGNLLVVHIIKSRTPEGIFFLESPDMKKN